VVRGTDELELEAIKEKLRLMIASFGAEAFEPVR